jgi:chemotaxis protein MotB
LYFVEDFLDLSISFEKHTKTIVVLQFLQLLYSFSCQKYWLLISLTQKGAENLERSLESIKEKDLIITRMQDAVTKRDSVTLALVQSFKSSLGTLSDDDIEINVEKGVVYVSISDKLLFNSGSFTVTTRARGVLEKIAKVISDKPDLEFMVEGHTDNLPIDQEKAAETIPGIVDNWDLSVKRATSVVRILQNSYGVDPTKLVAAGRSFYMPIADNGFKHTRAVNRRTRIIVHLLTALVTEESLSAIGM